MKRTELRRKMPMRSFSRLARVSIPHQRQPLKRTPMTALRSAGAKRQGSLRKKAYALVDERSGGWCEVFVYDPDHDPWTIEGGFHVSRCHNRAEQHHHRRPRRSGGSTDPTTETASNIVALCAAHHDGVESNRVAAYDVGLLIPAGHDPATTPVLLHTGWCYLTADGRYEPTEERA